MPRERKEGNGGEISSVAPRFESKKGRRTPSHETCTLLLFALTLFPSVSGALELGSGASRGGEKGGGGESGGGWDEGAPSFSWKEGRGTESYCVLKKSMGWKQRQ